MDRQRYRVRLRVRPAKSFFTDAISREMEVGGHLLTIKSQVKDQPLKEAEWIILSAGDFPTFEEANNYGAQLKASTELAALCSRLGVDAGQDQPTGWMNEDFAKAHGLIKQDDRLHPNIHGLIVIPDDERNRFPIVNATGTVHASLDQFSDALLHVCARWPVSIPSATKGVRLLNRALMTSEPIAQMVLAISAVEELGQDEKWSDAQLALISGMAEKLEADPAITAEGLEVADALRRSLYRVGLRQGVMRVLRRLGLGDLNKEWDRLYALRSAVLHGTADLASIELPTIAMEVVNLCGAIILTAAKHDGCDLPAISKTHFPRFSA